MDNQTPLRTGVILLESTELDKEKILEECKALFEQAYTVYKHEVAGRGTLNPPISEVDSYLNPIVNDCNVRAANGTFFRYVVAEDAGYRAIGLRLSNFRNALLIERPGDVEKYQLYVPEGHRLCRPFGPGGDWLPGQSVDLEVLNAFFTNAFDL